MEGFIMANCDICGTKLKLFEGIALSEPLYYYKICKTCYEKKEELLWLHNIDENVAYFTGFLPTVNNFEVNGYLRYIIDTPQRNEELLKNRQDSQSIERSTCIDNSNASSGSSVSMQIEMICLVFGSFGSIFEINNDNGLILPASILIFFSCYCWFLYRYTFKNKKPGHNPQIC